MIFPFQLFMSFSLTLLVVPSDTENKIESQYCTNFDQTWYMMHLWQFNHFYIMIESTLHLESNCLETSDCKIAFDQSLVTTSFWIRNLSLDVDSLSTDVYLTFRWLTNAPPPCVFLQHWPRSLQHQTNKFSPNYCYYLTWPTHTVCAKNLVNIRSNLFSSNNQRAFENNFSKLDH